MATPEVHSILGASGADRWMNCTPSARLTESMEDEGSVFAAEGTAAHALAEWKVRKVLKMRAGRRPVSDYWTDEMPIYPLLEHLMKKGKYKNLLLTLTDDEHCIVDTLERFANEAI